LLLKANSPFDLCAWEALGGASEISLLDQYASNHPGLSTGDNPRFRLCFWEIREFLEIWEPEQSTVVKTTELGGKAGIIRWERGEGQLWNFGRENVRTLHNVDRRGEEAWGKTGVGISQMQELAATIYSGHKFDTNIAVITPRDTLHLLAVWCFCSSPEYNETVRQIDQSLLGSIVGQDGMVPCGREWVDVPWPQERKWVQYPINAY